MNIRYQKLRLLAVFASTKCPACGKKKNKRNWVCVRCWEHMKNFVEHDRLKASCDAHLLAVKLYLARAKKTCGPE
jgi:hypothetical protein